MNAPVMKRGDLINTILFDAENLHEDIQPLVADVSPFTHLDKVLAMIIDGIRKAKEYEGYLKEKP
jgi:hypothetical protein